MAINIETQSIKFIKPFVPTPPTLHHYKIGFIDELAPSMNVSIVLFFSQNKNHNPKFVTQLQCSLAKTLTSFYPLAGRYIDESYRVDCNDEGVEFIHAKVNIKLQDILAIKENVKFVDKFIPSRTITNSLIAVQVTMFECGSVAIGVNAAHKIVDASTLCTFLNNWAARNQDDKDIELTITMPSFISSTLFPGRCFKPIPLQLISDDDMSRKYVRNSLSFSESEISNMKAKSQRQYWSKVQLVAAIVWKARIAVDIENNNLRESILLQAVNLRGKTTSLIPKHSCGNLWGFCATEAGTVETTTEELVDRLTDNIKKTVNNLSKVDHNTEEGQLKVLNTFSIPNIRESTNVITVTSWCKFPFYEADFGFGKPRWIAPGCVSVANTSCLMDEPRGNGVEAHVLLEAKDVMYFEKALQDIYDSFGF